MNQPTWEDFQRLEEGLRQEFREEQRQLKEEVRKLREQMTEPITIPRIELDPGGIQSRLDNHAELLKEISQKQDKFAADVDELKIDAKAYTGDAAIFKNKVERVESDVSTIKTDVGTLKGDVSTLKTDMEQVKTVQSGHSKYFEEHGRRLGQIEANMATKGDLNQLASRFDKLESTQQRQESMLQQILDRLPPKQ